MTITLSIEALIGLAGLIFTVFCTIVGLLYAIFRKLSAIELNHVSHVVCEKRMEEAEQKTDKLLNAAGVLSLILSTICIGMLISGCSMILE